MASGGEVEGDGGGGEAAEEVGGGGPESGGRPPESGGGGGGDDEGFVLGEVMAEELEWCWWCVETVDLGGGS